MSAQDLEKITALVARAVQERLGGQADGDVLEIVVREVAGAMSGTSKVPPPSTPAGPSAVAAQDNGDGTVTTGLGAVLGRPAGQGALELCAGCLEQQRSQSGNRAVVTTSGRNQPGQLAAIATEIAGAGGDIQDVSQTIVAEFFTMIMVVEIGQLSVPFEKFQERLRATSERMGVHAVVMHESVLQALQRV